MKNIKNKIDKELEVWERPLNKAELEKIIYNLFCIIIFITPIFSDIIGFGIYSLKSTIFNLTTMATTISLLVINRKNLKINIYDGLLLGYLLLVILSTLLTKYGMVECILGTNGRGEGLITMCSYVGTFIIFSRGYKYMTNISQVVILSSVVVSIYCIIQSNIPSGATIPIIPKSGYGLAKGTMGNQNFLSSYICIFLPMICFYFINGANKRKTAVIIATMLFLSLVFSTTLGGYITFIFMYLVIVFVSLIFSRDRKNCFKRILILSLILIVAFGAANYDGENKYGKELASSTQEVTKLVNSKTDNSFGTNRMKIWKMCFKIIKDYPLLGVGPDSMVKVYNNPEYVIGGEEFKERIDKAHSEPLHMAVTTGTPSAIIYLILVAIIGIELFIIVIKRLKNIGVCDKYTIYMSMVLIAFASYLIQSLANISVIQVAPMFWAIFGTAAGITTDNKISTL